MAEVFSLDHILLCQEQLEVRDRRIAALEAALSKYGRHLPTCYGDTCDCGFCDLDAMAELDAALAAAKREALEAAAVKVKEVAATWSAVAEGTLFQMAREVKP